MELQLKNKLLLLTAVSLTISSCEKEMDFPSPEHSVNQRFSQSMDWNESHPYKEIVVQSEDYSILFIGDTHVGSTNNLDKFFGIANASKASAVVMVGDLTNGKEEDYPVFDQCLQQKDSLLTFFAVGNHDLWSNSGWIEFFTRFGPSCYLFTVKSPEATDLFISLDSGSTTFGTEQLEWLSYILQTLRPECRHCIVYTHINLFRVRHTTSTNLLVEELDLLLELFTKNNVEMVITGHDHEKDATVFGITTYIQVPALMDGLRNAGYFEISVKNEDVKYKFEGI
jgi:predicted phosphodiesterase